MSSELFFQTIPATSNSPYLQDIQALLATYDLNIDTGVEIFVVALQNKHVVACAGIDHNVIKCVAIAPELRSEKQSLQLIQQAIQVAADRGYFHLFLFTKPENETFFRGCGFYTIETVPGFATLMENTPVGLSRYCAQLAKQRQPGNKIGAIVVNANPFTLGHRYLIEQALATCDWLHLFVVREDVSMFSYADRLSLVRQGVADLPRLSVHEGSNYMISKATFPTYFLKEQSDVSKVSTALDLLIFRNHIAPALGVTHRFVGTEPFCAITRSYNEDMKYWLQEAPAKGAPIQLIEIQRRTNTDERMYISASAVRAALKENNFQTIRTLVPDTTYQYLEQKYQKPPTT